MTDYPEFRLNDKNRLPRLIPAFKKSFAADQEIALYLTIYFLAGAMLIWALPHYSLVSEGFRWSRFLLCYFIFAVIVTALQFAIAFTHKERHFQRNATPLSSLNFIFQKIPLLLCISALRFVLDWLVVVTVILAAAGASGLRSKNIIGAIAGALLFAISWVLNIILDHVGGVFVRFGIPTAAYFEDKSLFSIPKISADIFARKTRGAFLTELNSDWLIFGAIAVILLALPIVDTVNNQISSRAVVSSVAVMISLIYFVKLVFTLIYCQFVSELRVKAKIRAPVANSLKARL